LIKSALKSHAPSFFKALKYAKFAQTAARILPLGQFRHIPAYARSFLGVEGEIEWATTQEEMLTVAAAITTLPASSRGVFVECGAFKGASSARLSLVCAQTGHRMAIFDSFEGMPANTEEHGKNIFGFDSEFAVGSYAGSLSEVQSAIRRFGCIDICSFHKGWFEETLPQFREPVAAAFIDVDLESSTRTCIKYLYPLLEPGGFIYSQDGHLPLIVSLLKDPDFWRNEVGAPMPRIDGLGQQKLIKIPGPR
jgi:O-methyltransferase